MAFPALLEEDKRVLAKGLDGNYYCMNVSVPELFRPLPRGHTRHLRRHLDVGTRAKLADVVPSASTNGS